jgi:hypothetical protein
VAATLAEAAAQFAELGRNLRLVGETELRRELYKAISDAAKPATDEIRSLANLEQHMPNGYAAVLRRDLQVTTHKRTAGADAGVTIAARAPTFGGGGRKIGQREEGRITHPVYGQGPRRGWHWRAQEAGMVPGFFAGPCERSAPRVRQAIIDAVDRVERKATGRP